MYANLSVLPVFSTYTPEIKFVGSGYIYLCFPDSICINWKESLDSKCDENKIGFLWWCWRRKCYVIRLTNKCTLLLVFKSYIRWHSCFFCWDSILKGWCILQAMASYNILNVVILNHPHPWQVLHVLMLRLSVTLADKPASKLAVACKIDSQGEFFSFCLEKQKSSLQWRQFYNNCLGGKSRSLMISSVTKNVEWQNFIGKQFDTFI